MKPLPVCILILLVTVLLSCCSSDHSNDYWPQLPLSGGTDIQIHHLAFDTIFLDDVQYSHRGEFSYFDNRIAFLDQTQGYLYLFTSQGKAMKRLLGAGHGPNEILAAHNFVQHENQYIVLGGLHDYYVLDPEGNIQQKGLIRWGDNSRMEEVYHAPRAEMIEIYELPGPRFRPRLFQNKFLLLPVHTEHFKFNGFTSMQYYRETRIFALLNIETGEIERIEGRRSQAYRQYQFLPNFDYFHFDIINDHIMVSYEIDPQMYILDAHFRPITKFGQSGTQMNTQYRETTEIDDAIHHYFADRQQFGYYDQIKYIKETGLIFRTYTRGGTRPYGLQIYNQDYMLIADLEVPPGLRIIGYAEGRYYAECKPGHENSPMFILTFQL